MRTSALIVAAGLPKCDGVPTAMYKVGAVSTAQHMIASFHKAGISPVFLVTDDSTRKLEKQLSNEGVLFLRAEGSPLDCAKKALAALPGDWERLFLCTADRPLVLPETIASMLSCEGELLLPRRRGAEAPFFLLSRSVAAILCEKGEGRSIGRALEALGLEKTAFETEDAGLFAGPKKALSDSLRLEMHQSALMRPMVDISVSGEQMVFDSRLINLLRQVELLRSVRAACEMTGMSYSVAWNLLNSAEEKLGYNLVSRNQGGRSGHGTELTEKGAKLLMAYTGFENALNEKMAALYESCFAGII